LVLAVVVTAISMAISQVASVVIRSIISIPMTF
jgi:hypothetical protein